MTRRWAVAVAMALLAGVLVSCGVGSDDAPRAIDKKSVPFGLLTTSTAGGASTTEPAATRVGVFFLRGGKLQLVQRSVRGNRTLRSAMDALFRGPTNDQEAKGTVSAIPPGQRVRRAVVEDDIGVVDVAGDFSAIGTSQQQAAVAQIVYTATEVPGIGRLRLLLNGSPVEVPLPDGSLTGEPVSRAAYASFA